MTKWKPVLAFSFIFLTLLLSPTSAQAPGETASGEMPIAGGLILSFSAPGDIGDFPLIPGQDNTVQSSLSILASGSWSVSVSDTNPTTGGKMTNYSNSQYNSSTKLRAYMGVTAGGSYGTGSCVTLDNGGQIANGDDLIGAEVIPIIFNQTVSWSDPVSAPDCVYRIVVTFTATG